MVKEYGYEYDASLDVHLWEKTKGNVTKGSLWGAFCLRSGRDALKVVAREYAPTVAFLPALACNSMILPFEMYGHVVTYYRLTGDYRIDIDSLEALIPQGSALFLYMDYFGALAIDDDTLLYLRRKYPKLIFVEDRTHNLIWQKERSFTPDYTVASLRKWLNVPDGGLLWANLPLRCTELAEDTVFSRTRLKAQCLRRDFFASGDSQIKRAYRQIFSVVSDIMDGDKMPSRMSAYAFALAQRANWDKIRQIRKGNAETLISVLIGAKLEFIQPKSGLSDLYVAFKVSDRNSKQRRLSAEGIFNTVIWPLNDEQKKVCPVARVTEETMLAAPCDQRYTQEDMRCIGKEMVRVFNA